MFWEAINGPVTRTVAAVEVDDKPGVLFDAYIGPVTLIVDATAELIPTLAADAYTLPVKFTVAPLNIPIPATLAACKIPLKFNTPVPPLI